MPRLPAADALVALFPEAAGDPLLRLRHGLLRAAPRGRDAVPCLSGVAQGGALSPERILAGRGWETPELIARATAGRAALTAARIGGDWWQGGDPGLLPAGGGFAVITLGDAEAAVRNAMLQAALEAYPADRLVVLAPGGDEHRRSLDRRGIVVFDRPVEPWLLLGRAAHVYCAGGELGFLALIAGIPVSAFAASFYTGWGVTEDSPGVPQHSLRRTADEIFAAHSLVATRYRDPFRDTPTSFEEALTIAAEWRRVEEANRGIAVCVGMSFWKRRRIAEFVRSTQGVPVFSQKIAGALAAARGSGAIAGWASRLPPGLDEAAEREGIPLIRVEDGFIRSVGLGSDFTPPASLVFDSRGMYFDPRVRSDLEILLRETKFTPPLVERAQRLAAQLVARGVTKYNLASCGAEIDVPADTSRILVPGQVEDDLSIRFGGGDIKTNLGLLQAVRAANPDAFILYKPHPDVVAGHRKGAVPESEARRFADTVLRDGSTAALLAVVDELHTMTSLAGFEALLRGRGVTVYGRPFYAGWGLTTDRVPIDRGRHLSLAELVAGVLILYPRYLDPLTRLPCGPEVIIERLDRPELWRPGLLVMARRLQGAVMARLAHLRGLLPTGGAPARRLPD